MLREAQLMMMSSDPNMQRAGKMLAEEANRIQGVQTKAEEKRVAATTGRGEGELMALANDPQFELNNPKMRSGYIGMADSFGVSRKRAMEIALKAREDKEKGKGGEGQTFAGAGRYKDKNDNIYVATEVRTKGGGIKIDYSPVTPGAPEQPEGPLTPIGGAYGETAGEKTGRSVEETRRETEAKDFAELRIAAIDNIPKIESTIVDAEKALGLLDNLKTGGFTTQFVRSAQRFIGVEPKDQAQFNLKAGEVVLKSLDNFPGAISNAEREYLERLYFSLEKSGGANQGILEELLEAAQFALKDAKARASSDTFQDYLDNRPSRVASVAKEEGPKKVNFNDLK